MSVNRMQQQRFSQNMEDDPVKGQNMEDDPVKGAIQIVKTKKEYERETDTQKIKIKVVQKHGNNPSLENVLLHPDVKDLTILVFSIAGKTKGGKSFLLSLMVKYLESLSSKSGEDWASGIVPSGFDWKCGTRSVTKGLWLWPKVYKLKISDNSEVGILLLDNEGLFAADAMDGEVMALSGISTALSYIQMFNVEKRLTSEYLENIVRYLVKGIESLDCNILEDLKQNYNLMFLVRDWTCIHEHPYGLDGGKDYIKTQKDCEASEETQLKWKEVYKTFKDIQCLLLPHPGIVAESLAFEESRDLSLLESSFVGEVKTFIEHLFAPSNLIPPSVNLTGESFYNLLMKVDGKFADDSMSFMNLFTDHVNLIKVGLLMSDFRSKLIDENLNLIDIKNEMDKIMERAERELMKGKSYNQHCDNLYSEMSHAVKVKAQKILLTKYEKYLDMDYNTVEMSQITIWPIIRREMRIYLCGKIEDPTKEEATIKIVQEAAKIYYRLLCEEIIEGFRNDCNKKDLEGLAGFDHKTIKTKFTQCNDFANTIRNEELVSPIWIKQKYELKDKISDIFLKRVNKLTETDFEWLKKSKHQQWAFFEAYTLLGKATDDINIIPQDNEGKKLLQKKLGFAMFGLPSMHLDGSNFNEAPTTEDGISSNEISNNKPMDKIDEKNDHPKENSSFLQSIFKKNKHFSDDLGYTVDEEKSITAVCDKIFSLSAPPILFSYIFVNFKKDGKDVNVPVFIVKTGENKTVYLDTNCRVYNSWDDFRESNTLADVLYCYPVNGKYDRNEDFIVAFAKAPGAKVSSKVLKAADHTGTAMSVCAGVAGVVALVGVAPIVGPAAIIGGASTALYKVARSCMTIKDKLEHKEKIRMSDVWNVASNVVVAASMGAGVVADQFVVAATRAAHCLNGLNAVNVITMHYVSEDITNVIEMLNEIAETTLKTMFYFNATSFTDAIKIIQQAMQLNDESETKTVLETLVQFNSIEYYVEIGGDISVQKFVSQGITTLITSLLKTINPRIKKVVLTFQEICEGFNSFQNMCTSRHEMEKKICTNMEDLLKTVQIENDKLRKRVQLLVNDWTNCDQNTRDRFLSMIESNDGHHIVFIIRFLVCSVISKIQEANHFFNNVKHKPVVLQGYDAEFHPQDEVYSLITGLLDQNKTTIDLTTDSNIELDKFLVKILSLLFELDAFWEAELCKAFLSEISLRVIEELKKELKRDKEDTKQKENLKCSDLDNLFKHTGKHVNYGNCLLDNVLDNLHSDSIHCVEKKSDITVVPAWNGVINGLFSYHSDRSWESKLNLVHIAFNIEKNSYVEFTSGGDLIRLEPSEPDKMEYYLVYSKKINECENGFIWCY